MHAVVQMPQWSWLVLVSTQPEPRQSVSPGRQLQPASPHACAGSHCLHWLPQAFAHAACDGQELPVFWHDAVPQLQAPLVQA